MRTPMRFFIKFILISTAYYLVNEPFITERIENYILREIPFKIIGFAAQIALATLIITLFSMTHRILKWLFLAFFLLNSTIYLVYYHSVGAALTFNDFTMLFEAKGMAGDAFLAYYPVVINVIALHIPLFIAYFLFPSLKLKQKGTIATMSVYAIVLILLAGALVKSQGLGVKGRPSYMMPTVQFSVYQYFHHFGDDIESQFTLKERPSLDSLNIEKTPVNTLIIAIDESINWDLIDLNGNLNTTPSILNFDAKNIVNLGKAISYANCSDLSNASIRKFVRYGEEEADLLAEPLIYLWETAKQAGFTPYLLDAQHDGVGHNYFTPMEIGDINVVPTTDIHSDAEIIDRLVEVRQAKPEEKQLFLIIKKGSHFPYQNIGFDTPFAPVMKSTVISHASREEVINSYKNLTRFHTDQFFTALYKKISYQDDTVMIYTSDHGQSFLEPGKKSFHCDTRNPDNNEAIVPLLVIGPESIIHNQTMNQINSSSQTKSHYLIPPLIMSYLGYQDSDIQKFTEYQTVLDSKTDLHFVYRRAIPHFETTAGKRIITQEELEQL